ncbi:hypothetical protein [Jutongia sp.]
MGTERKKWRLIFLTACVAVVVLYGLGAGISRKRQSDGQKETMQTSGGQNAARPVGDHGSLRLYLGELSGHESPFHTESAGDKRLMSLVYQRVRELADITVKRQKKGAVYEICLHPDVTDSQGRLVTADTLLYNYYLRCQTGYTGDDRVCEVPVKGLSAYRYGASGKALLKRKKKTAQALKKPDKTLRRQIARQLVMPVLRREYQWVRSLYYDTAARKLCQKYPDPVQLFAYYYAPSTAYTGKGKDAEKAVDEIADQYGADLDRLSEMTGNSYREKLQGLAVRRLWKQTAADSGTIAGISKVDDRKIRIETTKYRRQDLERLGEIYLVMGTGEQDGYLGTGLYILQQEDKETVPLYSNSYYQRGAANPTQLLVPKGDMTAVECIRKICAGSLDMACVWERVSYEKDKIGKMLKKGDALWECALLGGVVYHPGRVNATTLRRDAVEQEDIFQIVSRLEMNQPQETK